ncbi:DNA polymerase III subunit beta [Micromonospora carbonacea]|uniref:Beta sliding clamp n=1 Tax=Micromonospora carbonacea TaxID=47853 RepID=A0A1C5ACJ6_9ACTN|nr:DNA polymerase III subunit beta [Micromonospora carbonacea]SCF42972.1 DNA polymerase III, beta subunit [Micromonospora carbonacea]
MKITAERDALAEAVTTAAKALPQRPQVPVMAGVLLTTANDGVTVKSFDYEVSNELHARGTVADPGSTLVSARLLAEITKALPNKPVELATVGAHLELVCGSARFTLPTMPVEDYPALPAMPAPAGTVDAAQFATAVAQVAVAAGRDESLPMMTGVRMELAGNKMALLATDRYRLAVRELDWKPADTDASINALIPARTLHDTAKALGPLGGEVTIALAQETAGEGMIGFARNTRRTTSRLLDGANYPPVRSLFPKPEAVAATAVVPVAALVEVVKRVALVADRTTPVLLSFSSDGLVVEAGGTEEARASEAMEATFTGDPLTIGFNPAYLIDGLNHLGSRDAHFAFVDANKPAVITPAGNDGQPVPGYRYLIMPIRVSR